MSSSSSATAAVSANSTSSNYFTNLGLGYPIAIALGFLVLLSILLLASYICCRSASSHSHHHRNSSSSSLPRNPNPNSDGCVINSYPKFPYERDVASIKESTCSICLCEYKDSEMLRMMPECRHYFHLCCLDAWLKLNGSCPVCRNSPLPTPLSTPLQEVVPLSQFAADRRRSR
uniref:RING-type domain-containing protein n=1 Tax=Cannabis sativa TaxID=3483 RepID=A0A803QS10_CANSA